MTQEPKKHGIQVQSVARALEIIRCFERTPELGLSELASQMELNKSTVFGLVNTLASYGYLEQVESSRKYRLGITLLELGDLVLSRIDVRAEVKECCAPLALKYPATIHIATHSEGEVVYIDKVDRGSAFIRASSVGMRAPMHCTGVGKALLAYLPETYLDQYIWNRPLEKRTENTITKKEDLLRELAEVRRTGVAVDREEIERGVYCIAAPVLRRNGEPELAVSLSFAISGGGNVDLEEARQDLLTCMERLAARLGCRKEG